jgi:hypothetical protein
MPKFFIPPAPGSDDERLWQEARHRAEVAGYNCGASKIFKLVGPGGVTVQVGERDSQPDENGIRAVVRVIFDAQDQFVVVTVTGTLRPIPKNGMRAVQFC